MKYLCLIQAKAIAAPKFSDIHEDDYVVFHDTYFAPYATWCASQILKHDPGTFYAFIASLLDYLA